jgi:hypothetical protein
MSRVTFTTAVPKPGAGPRIFLTGDGRLTCSYDPPRRMAMDAMPRQEMGADPVRPRMGSLPAGPGGYGRGGRDNGGGESDVYDDDWDALFALLRDNLSPEDCAKAEALVVRLIGADPIDGPPSPDLPDDLGVDQPPAFRGRPPRPGMDPPEVQRDRDYSRVQPSTSPGLDRGRLAGDAKRVVPRPARTPLERRFGPDVNRLRLSEPGPASTMAADAKSPARPRPDSLVRRFGPNVGRLRIAP